MPTCRPWRNTRQACADADSGSDEGGRRAALAFEPANDASDSATCKPPSPVFSSIPIKSCRGTRLRRAVVTERGLAHDREWMIVDGDGRFITQREEPRLALVAPTLRARAAAHRAGHADASRSRSTPTVTPLSVTVFRDTVRASIRARRGHVAVAVSRRAMCGWCASIRRNGAIAIPHSRATPARTRRSPTAIRCWSSSQASLDRSQRGDSRSRCR